MNDEQLREKLLKLSTTQSTYDKKGGNKLLTDVRLDKLLTIIDQHTAQAVNAARVEELKRIDTANKGNGISFLFEDYPYNNCWCNMRNYIKYRLSSLTQTKNDEKCGICGDGGHAAFGCTNTPNVTNKKESK